MDLRTRAIKSAGWDFLNRVGGQLLSWAVTIVLARVLSPGDFGLFGLAFSVIGFLELFQQLGLSSAMIQRLDLSRKQINGIFFVVCGLGLLVGSIGFLSAPLVAAFYSEPRLVWLVRALAVIFVAEAVGMVPNTLLMRDIEFRRRSLAEAAATVGSAMGAISLAYLGHGVWALVGGQLIRAIIRNGLKMLLCGWLPGRDVTFDHIRELLQFGVTVAGATFLREFSGVVNTAIVGRVLGVNVLGLYSMAATIAMNPFHKLSTAVLNQLSLPVFAKMQNDEEMMRRWFLRISKYLAVMSLPTHMGIFLVADHVVRILLSEEWLPIIPVIEILCFGGIWMIVPLPCPPLLTARGRARLTFRWSAVTLVVMAGCILAGTQFGLRGVAVGWTVGYCAVRTVLVGMTLRELALKPLEYLRPLIPAVAGTVAMVAAVILVRSALPVWGGAVQQVICDVAVGVVVYVATVGGLDRALSGELRMIVHSLLAGSRA